MHLTTSIIPSKQHFAKKKGADHTLNLEAICVFIATGFFMDDDTYWRDKVCLAPAHRHEIDKEGYLLNSTPTFQWFYQPQVLKFEEALESYQSLLTNIIREQIKDNPVILPLSGGLDSRSQALVLKQLKHPVHAFSYAFENGYPEYRIAQQIAAASGFRFDALTIPKGYLWHSINELAQLNGCYSEFTHPRQMAVLAELKQMEGVFSLGHWGDVLFDRGVPESLQEKELVPFLLKKMVKPKGLELSQKLWSLWGLEGDFKSYLIARIETALSKIHIDNLSAKARAFKTSQWAHRWTTTNLCVFVTAHPITLPYYHNDMCEFICTIPEAYLADRKLQIAHLKQDTSFSRITWQSHRPFNLTNFHFNKTPYNIPYRIQNKLQRQTNALFGKPYIQRNWELQFLGNENAKHLEGYLFDKHFNTWIPKSIVNEFYGGFKKHDAVLGSHAVSMLLTLSLWHRENVKK